MKYELRDANNTWYEYGLDLYRIEDDGTPTCIGGDYGEPEDSNFYRDYRWVPKELNRLASIITNLKVMLRAAGVEEHWIKAVMEEAS